MLHVSVKRLLGDTQHVKIKYRARSEQKDRRRTLGKLGRGTADTLNRDVHVTL